MPMLLASDSYPSSIFERHFALTCPYCGVRSNISAVSTPRFEYFHRFHLNKVGIVYRCDSCNEPIFLQYTIVFDQRNGRYQILDTYEEVEHPKETFEFKYLSGDVRDDFAEALSCYSNRLLNAFAAICRRTIQSVCAQLGVGGTDRVMNRLEDARSNI